MPTLQTTINGISWPPIPKPHSAVMLAILHELDQSQWWPLEVVQTQQFRQINSVLSHAYNTVPFYQQRFDALSLNPSKRQITPEIWQNIPLLSRQEIQDNLLLSRQIPTDHGETFELRTSGTTGQPVITKGTQLTRLFWDVFTIREQLWSKLNLSGKLAAIRSTKGKSIPPEGKNYKSWGSPTNVVYQTGPAAMLNISTDLSKQLQWLQQQNPDYLITYPSNLSALAIQSRERGIQLPNLRRVRTFGGMLPSGIRSLCKAAWNVDLTDMYSSNELGYIALQCPDHEHYHIQAENVYVEVLDKNNQPCKPGEIGKIVITGLHNFATPLIRYDIRDYAEVGPPCPCGRGLPVITRIVGRERNMLTMPSGEKQWPHLKSYRYTKIAPISQVQFIQQSFEEIEVRLVAKRAITKTEEKILIKAIQEDLGHSFTITLTYYKNEIPQGANGKIEEFASMLS